MEIRCARCGKKLGEKHYMIQTFVYLGSQSPRRDICKNCYDAFINFMALGYNVNFDGGMR